MSNPIHLLIASVEYLIRYEAGSRLAGVIYMHRISDRRFTGISGRNFEMFRKLCGDSALKNAILVTNMWGEVPRGVGEAREQELITKIFKPALDKKAQHARHYNTAGSAHNIIRRIMNNKPIALQIQRERIDERKDIIDTAAGKELTEQSQSRPAELKGIREELETEIRELTEQVDDMRKVSEGMESKHQEEKRQMEEAMRQMQERARQEREHAEARYRRQMEEQARQEREQAEARHRRQMEELEERLQESINSSAETEAMQGQMNQLQHQAEKRQMEEGMRQMQERLDRQERERQIEENVRREMKPTEAEYKKRVEGREKNLQEGGGASAAERKATQGQINRKASSSALSRMFGFGRTCSKCQESHRTRAVK